VTIAVKTKVVFARFTTNVLIFRPLYGEFRQAEQFCHTDELKGNWRLFQFRKLRCAGVRRAKKTFPNAASARLLGKPRVSIQVLIPAREWRFKPSHPHQQLGLCHKRASGVSHRNLRH